MSLSQQEADDIGLIRSDLANRLAAIKEQLKTESMWRDPWNGPLHAAEVGALNLEYQWLDVLLRSVLFNYETALNNWYLNDAAYKAMHLPTPPKPELPATLYRVLELAGADK